MKQYIRTQKRDDLNLYMYLLHNVIIYFNKKMADHEASNRKRTWEDKFHYNKRTLP